MSSMSTIVAKHYNELKELGLDARKESRIFYMRSFNNWIKSMLISSTLSSLPEKNLKILDMCCGKGGDIQKWLRARSIDHVVFVDIAETSVEQCRQRYDSLRWKNFTAEFITADCSKETISTKFSKPTAFDMVSVQFSFHYSFESLAQAEKMLSNISTNLRIGGYFIGTIPNANRIVKYSRQSNSKSFGNDVFQIRFESDEPFPIFGAKYFFQLDDVVNCPEFLVHFGTFQTLCKKHGLELKYKETFEDYFQHKKEDGKALLERMNALETYPGETPAKNLSDYSHVTTTSPCGTLSRPEWETIALYILFCFEKVQ